MSPSLGTVTVPVKLWKDVGNLKAELLQLLMSVLVGVLMAWVDSGEALGQFVMGAAFANAIKSAILAYFRAKEDDVVTGLQHFDGPPAAQPDADVVRPADEYRVAGTRAYTEIFDRVARREISADEGAELLLKLKERR